MRATQYITLAQAAKLVPSSRVDKAVHPGTLYRWSRCGLNGVRLETTQVGGTLCTSEEALGRFFDALTRARERKLKLTPLISTAEANRRDAEDQQVRRLLGEAAD